MICAANDPANPTTPFDVAEVNNVLAGLGLDEPAGNAAG
jgi:hypothetical protein